MNWFPSVCQKWSICVFVLLPIKIHEFNVSICCSYYPYKCLNCPIFYLGWLLALWILVALIASLLHSMTKYFRFIWLIAYPRPKFRHYPKESWFLFMWNGISMPQFWLFVLFCFLKNNYLEIFTNLRESRYGFCMQIKY